MIYVVGAIAVGGICLLVWATEKSFLETMGVLACFLVYYGFWLRGRRKEAERRHATIIELDQKIVSQGGTSERRF